VGTDELNIIIMNMLEEMANDIVKSYKKRLSDFEGMPKTRMSLLIDMHNELLQLKKTFTELYPNDVVEVEEVFTKLLK
jgi:hypothetical protein